MHWQASLRNAQGRNRKEKETIVQVEKTIIGDGKEGEITKKIRELYQKIVSGKESRYLKWLEFIQ